VLQRLAACHPCNVLRQVRSVVGFGATPATIIVVSSSGTFYTASFNPQKGGMCEQRHYARFLETTD
jgi:hypothetical protein